MPRLVALVAAVALGTACGDPPPSNYPTQSYFLEDNQLGPDDQLDVVVYLGGGTQKLEDVSKVYPVSADGSLSFPMIGTVNVAGRSPADVEQEIKTRLADGYIVNPNVTVQVKEYKSKKVSILGEVRKAGTLSWRPAMTISEAVSDANGFTAMAKPNAVVVTRRITDAQVEKYTVPVEKISNNRAPQFYLRPGDSVYVPKRLW
ncbi:MAG: polysaccharide biosynthesis/export family protein [Kofleriaceae bacterium]